MDSIQELERKLAEAKRIEARRKVACSACDGKGWFCDSTYDRSGVNVSCDRCHGSGKPDDEVRQIISAAFLPHKKHIPAD